MGVWASKRSRARRQAQDPSTVELVRPSYQPTKAEVKEEFALDVRWIDNSRSRTR